MDLKTVNIKNDVLTSGHGIQNRPNTKTASPNKTRCKHTLSPHKPSTKILRGIQHRHFVISSSVLHCRSVQPADCNTVRSNLPEQYTMKRVNLQQKKVHNLSRVFHDRRTKNYISLEPKWKQVYSIYWQNFHLNCGSSTTGNVKVKLSSDSSNTVQIPRPQK